MINEELINFIRAEHAKGTEPKKIVKTLIKAGWSESDIDQAFKGAASYEQSAQYKQQIAESEMESKMKEAQSSPEAQAQRANKLGGEYLGAVPNTESVEETGSVQKTFIRTPITDAPEAHGLKKTETVTRVETSSGYPVTDPKEIGMQVEDPKKTSGVLGGILITFIILILAAIGFYFYRTYVGAAPITYSAVVKSLAGANTVEYTGDVQITVRTDLFEDGPLSVRLDTEGAYDASNPESFKNKISFKGRVDQNTFGTYTMSTDSVYVDDISYFRINALPELPFFDISQLEGQWILIDLSTLAEDAQELGADLGQYEDVPALLNSRRGEVLRVLGESEVLRITNEIGVEDIHGVRTTQYAFELDKIELKRLIDRLLISLEEELPGDLVDTDLQINSLLDSFNIVNGRLWIDKRTSLPYKINFRLTITPENQTGGFNQSDRIDITVDYEFKNYHKPVDIQVPLEADPIEEVLEEIFGNFLGSSYMNSIAPFGLGVPINIDEAEIEPYTNDAIRLADINAIIQTNARYKAEFETYAPDIPTLLDTYKSSFITSLEDPVTGRYYSYSRSVDGQEYHVGATLELDALGVLETEAVGFNSLSKNWRNGFNASGDSCSLQEFGVGCYDYMGK